MNDTNNDNQGYADFYLLAVPKTNLDAYKAQATEFGNVLVEHGGLNYREFMAEDLAVEGGISFNDTVTIKDDEVLTTAVAEFKSRAHRDEVMDKVMADPRIKAMMSSELADMSRMHYGGFSQFVQG